MLESRLSRPGITSVRRIAAGAVAWAYSTRRHEAREAVRAELLAEVAGGPIATETNRMGTLTIAELARGVEP